MRDPRLWQDDTFGVGDDVKAARAADARALGASLAGSEPSKAAMDSICEQMRNLPWLEFETAFVEAVPIDRKQDWIAVVQHCLEIVPENLDRLYGEQDAVIRAIHDAGEAWKLRRQIEPWSIWSEHVPDVNLSDHLLVRLLPQMDLALWTQSMEQIESPIWLKALTSYSHVQDDRDLLLRLVEQAPLAFEKNWDATGAVVVLIAAKWLVFHAVRIRDAIFQSSHFGGSTRDLDEFREVELPQYLDTAFARLLCREDGLAIAAHLSAYLADLMLRPSSHVRSFGTNGKEIDIYLVATERLAAAIRSRVTPPTARPLKLYMQLHGRRERAAKQWAKQKPKSISVGDATSSSAPSAATIGEGARGLISDGLPPWVAALAYVYVKEPLDTSEIGTLWGLLADLLEQRDPSFGLALSDERHSVRATGWMAQVLALQESPTECWCSTYAKLEGQRRRAQAASRYGEYDGQRPSWVLLRVGMGAIELLPSERRAERERLFTFVESAARRQWLTVRPDFMLDWNMAYAKCVAAAFAVFESNGAEKLVELWERLASSTWLICASATMLHERGIPVGTIDGCARSAGLDLVKMLNSQLEWTGKSGTVDYPPGFDVLLDALVELRRNAEAT